MKKLFLTIIAVMCLKAGYSQTDSVYFYYNGTQYWYYIQTDVYNFRLDNGDPYTGLIDTTVVDSILYNVPETNRETNIAFFDLNSTEAQRETFRDAVRALSNFDRDFLTITNDPNLDRTYFLWRSTNDLVLVTFSDPYITNTDVNNFANNFGLTLYQAPSTNLPAGRHTYIFKLNNAKMPNQTSIERAAYIYEQSGTYVYIVEPDIVDPPMLFSNDPYFADEWHIKNTTQCLGQAPNGTPGPDAKCRFEDVWNYLGYTGGGVTVAVIDIDGFELNHPDLDANFITGWNAMTNTTDVSPSYSGSAAAHGQACAGLIAAEKDNSIGGVGVAPNAKIYPIKIGGTQTSTYVTAFQKAQENADVVSANWGYLTQQSASFANAINNCKTQGRGGLGCVLVFGSGNMDGSFLSAQSETVWPGSSDDVIGVNATNPTDKLKTTATYNSGVNDGWGDGPSTGADWASNFGTKFDVSAPGTHMITTDYQGSNGFNGGASTSFYGQNYCTSTAIDASYTNFLGTSASGPLVAGLAALLICRNSTLTSDEVQMYIQDGAEKVGGYDYNAVSTGRSLELGYGRINAFNSLQLAPMSAKEKMNRTSYIKVINPANETLNVFFSEDNLKQVSDIILYDLLGRPLVRHAIEPTLNQFSLDISFLPSGIYFATFTDSKGSVLRSEKVIKIK